MIDLHMHSKYSDDGEYSPAELVEQCAKAGIHMMSIADHNCIQANLEAPKVAEQYGITYVPGIEIDCTYDITNLHVLGYGIDVDSPDFQAIEENIRKQGMDNSLKMLEKTQCLGFRITENDLCRLSAGRYWKDLWTGEMFAEVLLEKEEYLDHPLLEAYRPGGSRSDNPYVNFYWDYYAQGKPCYVKTEYPSAASIVEIIHQNGGIAVLAHPGVNLNHKEDLLPGILDLGMDGIEVYSSYHSPLQNEFYLRKAEEYGKLVTCGSDYHGKTKPAISLGQHHAREIEIIQQQFWNSYTVRQKRSR